jgi:hypothetical protein
MFNAQEGNQMQATATQTLTAELIRATAFRAADAYFMNKLGGRDQYACGFAWVTVYPEHKGNTRAGKAERKELEALGFRKDWTGKAYQLWNPAGYGCQNVDTLEAGAEAAAQLLQSYGYKAYSGSRLD